MKENNLKKEKRKVRMIKRKKKQEMTKMKENGVIK